MITPYSAAAARKILITLFITIFIDMLGIGILIPVFPVLFAPDSSYRITPLAWSDAQDYILAGWLMASYPFFQFLAAPILGQLADIYGRRKVLLFSLAGTGVSYVLFAYAIYSHNLVLMFLSRSLDGITSGNISVAQTIIGDVSSERDLARNFGMVGVALGLGFICGPILGGKLADPHLLAWFSPETPFLFAAGLCGLNLALVRLNLPETRQISTSYLRLNCFRAFQNIRQAINSTYLRQIIPAIFLFNAGFAFYTTFWGIVLAQLFKFNQSQIGNFFGYMGLMVVLAQGGLVRRLSGRVQDYKVLNWSLSASGLCIGLFYLIPLSQVFWIYWVPPFLAIFIALSKAFSNALLSRLSPAAERGKAMGINSSANALAQVFPAILAGYLAADSAKLPILIGAGVAILGGVYFRVFFRSCPNSAAK